MAVKIIEGDCVCCGECEELCEYGAIKLGEDSYVVDADKCTDCLKCYHNCAVGAIIRGLPTF